MAICELAPGKDGAVGVKTEMFLFGCFSVSVQVITVETEGGRTPGDFFQTIMYPESYRRRGLLLIDVCDKGWDSSRVGAVTGNLFHETVFDNPGYSPETTVGVVNQRLWRRTNRDGLAVFVTGLYIVLDPEEALLTMVNFGHLLPLSVNHQKKEVKPLSGMGRSLALNIKVGSAKSPKLQTLLNIFRLGSKLMTELQTIQLPLEPGDMVVGYTDGVTECFNPAGNSWELSGLTQAVIASGYGDVDMSSDMMLERITRSMTAYMGSVPLHDDTSLLVIQRCNNG